jgi:hypothetical protein
MREIDMAVVVARPVLAGCLQRLDRATSEVREKMHGHHTNENKSLHDAAPVAVLPIRGSKVRSVRGHHERNQDMGDGQ